MSYPLSVRATGNFVTNTLKTDTHIDLHCIPLILYPLHPNRLFHSHIMALGTAITGNKRCAPGSENWQPPKRPRTERVFAHLGQRMPTPEDTIRSFVSERLVQPEKRDDELVILAMLSLADLQEISNVHSNHRAMPRYPRHIERAECSSSSSSHAHWDGDIVAQFGSKLVEFPAKADNQVSPFGQRLTAMCKLLDRISESCLFQKFSCLRFF